MTVEQWRPAPSFSGYEASSLGNVRSVDRIVTGRWQSGYRVRGRVLKKRDRNGYLIVAIKSAPASVAAVVADAFHGPRPEGAVVRHLNDVRYDNRPENLAYGSHVQNAQDAIRNERYPHQRRFRCPQGHPFEDSTTAIERNDRGYATRRCRICRRNESARRQAARIQSTVGVMEAARILSKPVSEVKQMIDAGDLPSVKVAQNRRIPRSALPVHP